MAQAFVDARRAAAVDTARGGREDQLRAPTQVAGGSGATSAGAVGADSGSSSCALDSGVTSAAAVGADSGSSSCALDCAQIGDVMRAAANTFVQQRFGGDEVRRRRRSRLLTDDVAAACASALTERLRQAILTECPSAQGHKWIVQAVFMQQWGQGCHFSGRGLWDCRTDRAVHIDVQTDKYMLLAAAHFVKRSRRSSREEQQGKRKNEEENKEEVSDADIGPLRLEESDDNE